MELKQLWKIAWRWWWLILLPPLIVGAYGLVTYRAPAVSYGLSMRYTAGQPDSRDVPPEGTDSPPGRLYDPNYYRWLTSEYIVNALKDWARTGQFGAAVSAKLAERGLTPGASISGADNVRSILVISLSGSDPAQLVAYAEAMTAVLQEQNAEVFPQLGGQAAQVTPLDSPAPGPVPPSLRARLDLPLKLGLALAVGLALALAAHYFDPFIREKSDVERLGLKVVGEVPKGEKRKA